MGFWKRLRRPDVIRFHLTAPGWVFLVISLLVGVAAVNGQATLGFVVFGGMMGALHISALLSRRMVSGVRVRREVPGRVWQNQTVHLGYFLRNANRRGSALGLRVQEIAPEGIECVTGYCLHLPAQGAFHSGGRFVARRRGRIRLQDLHVSTTFPFGLVTANKRVREEASLVIWCARGRLKHQFLHRGATETSQSAPSPATGGADEFFGLREYRPDDNPRWIAWRRSAMRSTPVVREMSRPLPDILWVVVDTFLDDVSDAAARTREKMLRFATTLIDHAFARGYQVGAAVAYSDRVAVFPPAPGVGQRNALLDALADVDANTKTPPAEMLGRIPRGRLRKAVVTVVTPSAARLTGTPLEAIRAECQHLGVVTEDQLEQIYEDDPLAGWGDAPCR